MDLQERLAGLSGLGTFLDDYLGRGGGPPADDAASMDRSLARTEEENPWFTRPNLIFALSELARVLKKPKLERWVSGYDRKDLDPGRKMNVGVVMAGNLPLVGIHDFLSVLVSGHRITGKLSSRDSILLPRLADQLVCLNPGFGELIRFTEDTVSGCDAIIATGSDNTYRYFDYYFSHRPHIFRRNRNGVAVLTGEESTRDLENLADDIFLYFGLGCRNVSKLFVPEGYGFDVLFGCMEKYRHLEDHNKYRNNYDYQRSIHLLTRIPHLDNGLLIVKQDPAPGSPVATLHYETHRSPGDLKQKITPGDDAIQCVISGNPLHVPVVGFGLSQKPELWDYADNMDTLKFLINLGKN
jgi:hypothetical protein